MFNYLDGETNDLANQLCGLTPQEKKLVGGSKK